ncbi:CAunnamed protein product [Biomphalaria glabrata]|nr:CAunnamed protein product [Biomphalaria glabrata]
MRAHCSPKNVKLYDDLGDSDDKAPVVCNLTLKDEAFSSTTSSPNAPQMPGSIQETNSYQARVEVNILDKNYSMVVDEYLDYPGNRGLLKAYRNGKNYQLLYSYATGEVFHMSLDDQTCKVMNISDDPTSFIFGPVHFDQTQGAPQTKIFGSAAALRFAAGLSDVYNGTGTVRGIPADIWTTCMSWPNVRGLLKATFYFSQLGWTSSSPLQQVPLRIEIEGYTTSLGIGVTAGPGVPTISPNSPRHFHHMYDFINYLPYIDADPSIFETPPGIVCRKRVNTHPLPQFKNSFTYRTEIVDSNSELITHYAVWYNGDLKMVREDKRTVNPDPVLNTKDAITEIHDFETGVRYVMDQEGGCAIRPVDTQATDSKEDIARFKFNQSLVVDIRDPNSFFSFNDNYKYVGQRTVRGLECDVYNAIIPNFPVSGTFVNATFEYLFLGEDWDDLPLDGLDSDVRAYPVQLVISAPSVYYTRVYNFYDYAETFPIDGIYDVSQCFPENQKLYFRLAFPTYFSPKTESAWIKAVHMGLLTTMQVHPIRITDISVEGQDFNTYVNVVLLGTANAAQFEKIPASTVEHLDSKVFKGVTLPDECADLCIRNSDFTCQAFQYCPLDGFACRLLQKRVPTTDVLVNATQCDAFSRTIVGTGVREPFIREAFNSLAQAVAAGKFIVMIPNFSMGDNEPQKAINVKILSGQPLKNKTLPMLPTQFSYRLETVLPQLNRVVETFVWYDSMMDIVRYDTRDAYSSTPVMTTYIHDFVTGVAYQINQVTKQCFIKPIAQGSFDVVTGQTTQDGSLIVSLKSPQSMFYLDDSYIYVGEKTVRGILCDVFESRRKDFKIGAYNISSSSVFKFYFQSDGWDYVAPDSTDITRNQPVMLEIQDITTGSFITTNFYDFNDQHYTVNFYDTSPCIDPKEKQSFIIIFKNQPYHPILDQASTSFLNDAIVLMSEITMSSPIRFQQASVTYDDTSVYIKATALGSIPPFAQFSRVMDVGMNDSANYVYVNTPADCAASCLSNPTFTCNSFDLCNDPVLGQRCLLGQRHKESEGDPLTASNVLKICTHYSRSENVSFPQLDVEKMYEMITDNVYDNLFQITMFLPNVSVFFKLPFYNSPFILTACSNLF